MLIAIPITIKFFLPIYSKLGIDTAYHYLELRFDSKALRVLGALMFIVYQIGRMSIIMYLPSMVLANLTGINVNILIIVMGVIAIIYSYTGGLKSVQIGRMSIIMYLPSMVLANLTGINVNILIIVMGVIAIIYSYTGGLKSVLWTDFIQGSVLLIGVTFALIYLLNSIDGGAGAVFETLKQGKFLGAEEVLFDPNILKNSVFLIVVGAGFNTCSSYISSQDIVQRFTTTTDTKELNKMMLTNGALSIFIATVFYLIGTGLYVFYGQNPVLAQTAQQDQIFASYIAYQIPVGITGILLAAIYAASQSTLSTGLNSVATSWTLDIQERLSKKEMSFEQQTKIAQYVSLGVGIVAIAVSMILANGEIKSAYEWFNGFMGLVLGVLAGTFVLGVFTKVANSTGAFVAFAVSTIAIIFVKYNMPEVSIWSYSIITIGISLIVGIPVSYVSRKLKNDNTVPNRDTVIYE